jgi:hypothetical protein
LKQLEEKIGRRTFLPVKMKEAQRAVEILQQLEMLGDV